MRILEGAGEPLPQQEIAKRLLMSRANVTGLIDKLESTGFVERCSTRDRRVNLIQLTQHGFDFLRESHEALVEQCEEELRLLSPAERKELNRIASKLLREKF
jgi:MarR family 2-MHQ and catechol resistance regulon transcriptional repressor